MWDLGSDADGPECRVVDTDFETNLHAVVDTVDGQGSATGDNQLTALDVTDCGERSWFLGSSARWGVTT